MLAWHENTVHRSAPINFPRKSLPSTVLFAPIIKKKIYISKYDRVKTIRISCIYISLFSLDSWPIDSLDQNAIQTHVKSVSLPPRKDGQNEANNPLLLLVVVRSVESSKRERFSSLRKGRLIPRECDLSLHKRRRAAQNYKRHAVPLAYIYICTRKNFSSLVAARAEYPTIASLHRFSPTETRLFPRK